MPERSRDWWNSSCDLASHDDVHNCSDPAGMASARALLPFQSGALGRGVGGFCYVAIEQDAGEGQQSAGSAVDATALSLSV